MITIIIIIIIIVIIIIIMIIRSIQADGNLVFLLTWQWW